MSTRANVVCPKCATASCRESRWLSRDEKNAHPGGRPHRCLNCGHRFILTAPTNPRTRRTLLVAAISTALLAAGLTLFTTLSDDAGDDALLEAPIYGNDNGNGNAVNARLTDRESMQAAAHAGDADAQFRLARAALLDHSGGRESAEEAVRWLHKAAGQHHSGAMLQLGKLYRSGIGLTQNYAVAAQWIQAAALTGHSEAMVELGRLYRGGIGVERDLIQAYVWFNRAAAARNMEGVNERDNVALKLSAEELNLAQHHSLQGTEHANALPAPPAQ